MGGTFLAFLGLSAVVIVTPGPDTAVTVRNALLGGFRGGAMTALGVAAGQTIWAMATSAGIVALLVASEPLFLAVKYAGAAYLAWLGLHSLCAALRPSPPTGGQAGPTPLPPRRLGAVAAFRQGLVSDLGNPKMAVFFASLLPQFVPAGQAEFLAFLALGLVFAAMTLAWLVLYAALVARLGEVLRRPAIRRWIEGITGTVLLALGLRMAAEPR